MTSAHRWERPHEEPRSRHVTLCDVSRILKQTPSVLKSERVPQNKRVHPGLTGTVGDLPLPASLISYLSCLFSLLIWSHVEFAAKKPLLTDWTQWTWDTAVNSRFSFQFTSILARQSPHLPCEDSAEVRSKKMSMHKLFFQRATSQSEEPVLYYGVAKFTWRPCALVQRC